MVFTVDGFHNQLAQHLIYCKLHTVKFPLACNDFEYGIEVVNEMSSATAALQEIKPYSDIILTVICFKSMFTNHISLHKHTIMCMSISATGKLQHIWEGTEYGCLPSSNTSLYFNINKVNLIYSQATIDRKIFSRMKLFICFNDGFLCAIAGYAFVSQCYFTNITYLHNIATLQYICEM